MVLVWGPVLYDRLSQQRLPEGCYIFLQQIHTQYIMFLALHTETILGDMFLYNKGKYEEYMVY